jgi:hypothetical protein
MNQKRFSELNINDSVWVVYNKNYNNGDIQELILSEAKILDNYLDYRSIYACNIYKDSREITNEYWIMISVSGLTNKYKRYYSDIYDESGQMLITPDFRDCGPNVNVFITKEKAKEYIISRCQSRINYLNNKINKEQKEIKLNEYCINKIKDI